MKLTVSSSQVWKPPRGLVSLLTVSASLHSQTKHNRAEQTTVTLLAEAFSVPVWNNSWKMLHFPVTRGSTLVKTKSLILLLLGQMCTSPAGNSGACRQHFNGPGVMSNVPAGRGGGSNFYIWLLVIRRSGGRRASCLWEVITPLADSCWSSFSSPLKSWVKSLQRRLQLAAPTHAESRTILKSFVWC